MSDTRYSPGGVALASAFIPGLGQALQRRYSTAIAHFGGTVAFAAGAFALIDRRAMLVALVFNLWSVLEARWWENQVGSEST